MIGKWLITTEKMGQWKGQNRVYRSTRDLLSDLRNIKHATFKHDIRFINPSEGEGINKPHSSAPISWKVKQ